MPIISGGGAFNGGTITQPLVIAPADHNAIPLSIEAGWNAQNADFFRVLNTDTATRLFAVDVQGNTKAWPHTSEALPSFDANGATAQLVTPGNLFQSTPGKTLGFYGALPIVQQTGVPVTAAALHAALVNLGLITA